MLGAWAASAGGFVLASRVFFLCGYAYSIPCQLLSKRKTLGWTGYPDMLSSWLLERRGLWSWEAFGGTTDQMDLYRESV